jgi:hypothetical protein
MPAVPAGIIHVVKPGESLSVISKKYFGTPGYGDVIYGRNHEGIKNQDVPTPGRRLIIAKTPS